MDKKKYIILAVIAFLLVAAALVVSLVPHTKKVAPPTTTAEVVPTTTPSEETKPEVKVTSATNTALPLVFTNSKLSLAYPNNWKICSSESVTVLAENFTGECPPLKTNTAGRFDFPTSYKSAIYSVQTVDLKNGPSIGCTTAKECIALVKSFTDVTGVMENTYNGHQAICFNWLNETAGTTGTTWQIFFTNTDALTVTNNTSNGSACSKNPSIDAIFATVKAVK